jgi:amino acid transporter
VSLDGEVEGTKAAVLPERGGYGLRQGVLSPMEVLAQSISTIAPSTSPTLTVPLVFALAGVGTCLAYGLAMVAMVLVALCIAVFARDSASPGSLYVYTRDTLPPVFAAVTAWALFFAYVMIAASCVGGFLNYAYVLLGGWGTRVPAVSLALFVCVCAELVAYRDVKISARVMLWVEAVSVALILVVVGLTLARHGARVDWAQVKGTGATAGQIRLGVVLAMFSFVGFESATTLGAEAKHPLKTIPRAVVLSALLAGALFLVCAYAEVIGFRSAGMDLGANTAPFRVLAEAVGLRSVGVIIDAGVLVAMFAAVLGCVMAASRVAMLMAHAGLVSKRLTRTHARHDSPVVASVVASVLAFVPVSVLVSLHVSGADVYGYLGTLAVFGFLTAYLTVVVAMVVHLQKRARLRVSSALLASAACAAMLAAIVGSVYPVPSGAYRWLPFVYAAYVVMGIAWFAVTTRRRRA